MAGKGKPGRRSELDRKIRPDDPESPTIEARILELVRAGASYIAAARSLGLSERSAENWQSPSYLPTSERFNGFRVALQSAEHERRMAAELSIERAHRGIPVRTTRTIRRPLVIGGRVQQAANGEILMTEEVTVTDTVKVQWQAAAWRLERDKVSRGVYPRPAGSLSPNTPGPVDPADELSDEILSAELAGFAAGVEAAASRARDAVEVDEGP